MITMIPGRFYLGMYAVSIPKFWSDHQKGGICIVSPSCPLTDMQTWELEFHFRHYKDDKIHTSEDRRKGFVVTFRGKNPPDIEALIKDKFLPDISQGSGAEILEPFVIKGDVKKFHRLIEEGKQPKWFHVDGKQN